MGGMTRRSRSPTPLTGTVADILATRPDATEGGGDGELEAQRRGARRGRPACSRCLKPADGDGSARAVSEACCQRDGRDHVARRLDRTPIRGAR
jgi:hypothetical protein